VAKFSLYVFHNKILATIVHVNVCFSGIQFNVILLAAIAAAIGASVAVFVLCMAYCAKSIVKPGLSQRLEVFVVLVLTLY